jgi:hypothetical protein
MMLPMSVASSSGSPSFSAWVFVRSFSRKLSKMSACRNRREPAVQDWLWIAKGYWVRLAESALAKAGA